MAMQRRLALAAAVLALLAAGCAAQVQMCGAWEGFCQPYGDDFITVRPQWLSSPPRAPQLPACASRDDTPPTCLPCSPRSKGVSARQR